jgi:hypothetical protein
MPIPTSPTLIANNPALTLQSPGVVAALALDKAFTAADTSHGNCFQASGDDTLIVYNSDGSSTHTFTIWSVADSFGRYADFVYTVQPSTYSFVRIVAAALYTQSGTNKVVFTGSDATLKFLPVTNP